VVRLSAFLIIGASIFASSAAQAQVTGVVAHSSATVQFRPGAEPGDTGVQVFNGAQLAGSLGDNPWGSGASFASTSKVQQDFIEFQNGNAAGGAFSYLTSRTVVDISFTNDGDMAVTPSLHSTITPAGIGLFTGATCLSDLTQCSAGDTFPGDFRDFQGFSPEGPTNDIAGASFTFRISGDGETLYELQGSLGLAFDPISGANVLVSDLDAARGALSGFRTVSTPGDTHEFGFAWDATDFEVNFPKGTLLEPGESSTLTYETIVHSYSRTGCFELLTGACLLAYSSFGDPIGRGGTTRPSFARLAAATPPSDELGFDSFRFQTPTFKDGVLSYHLLPPGSAVPEPATWAMMITGFGLIGAAARRRRTGMVAA
jgi:hypothetical protein